MRALRDGQVGQRVVDLDAAAGPRASMAARWSAVGRREHGQPERVAVRCPVARDVLDQLQPVDNVARLHLLDRGAGSPAAVLRRPAASGNAPRSAETKESTSATACASCSPRSKR